MHLHSPSPLERAQQRGWEKGKPDTGHWAAPEPSRRWASGARESEAGSRDPGNRDVGLAVPTTWVFSPFQATPASGPCAYAPPLAHSFTLPVSAKISTSLRGLPCLSINSILIMFHLLSLLYFSFHYLPPVDNTLYVTLSAPLEYKLYKDRGLAFFAP